MLTTVLAALGAAERELAVGDRRPDDRRTSRPLGGLPSGWLTAANDGSTEFSLARSIAFIDHGIKGTGRIRRYLEPVEEDRDFWVWGEGGPHVVWRSPDVSGNLGAVLVRRLMDAEKNGEPLPPLGSPYPAPLDHVASFLNSTVDDAKIEEMLWGLSLVKRAPEHESTNSTDDAEPAPAYAVLKLTLLCGRLQWHSSDGATVLRINRPKLGDAAGGILVKPEPAILSRLRANDILGACQLGARRLRASGFVPLASSRADGRNRIIDWSASEVRPARLLAALLIPVPDRAVNQLGQLVLRYPSSDTLS